MNIAIVDDEQIEIEHLSILIREYAAINKLQISISTFTSGEEILEDYHPYAYTAIFMDIYMGGMTGIETSEKIREADHNAVIAFLTSCDDHMPEAFSLHAYDYISKPATKERIFKVLDDILMRKTKEADEPRLTIKDGSNDISLPYSDIAAVRTSRPNYLDIIEVGGAEYNVRLTFSEVVAKLEADSRFLQVMRGVLVNMDSITRIEDGTCIVEDRLPLPVNVRNEKELKTTWQNYKIDSIRSERGRKRQK